jgi:NAD-dependent dihydropyrimidine dehydrogenase PreA subunit
MKVVRKIIEIDEERCDGCGQCVTGCAEGALAIIDDKARVISDNLCDGLGACIGECPTGALQIVEREAEEFDEAAVEKHLEGQPSHQAIGKPVVGGGCPSAGIKMFAPQAQNAGSPHHATVDDATSALSHWPIKLRLVPPHAPFLKGADLLVLADCGAIAFPTLHRDLLQGRVVLAGCPKFDDLALYEERLTQIFRQADIRTITVVRMEVPCCAGLQALVLKGLKQSGADIPVEEIVISPTGRRVDTSLRLT